jgi:hypothetical protein
MASDTYHDQANIHPLPLGQAIRALPAQYLKIITRPSVRSFSEEKEKATWGSTWLQLIALGILSACFSVLANLIAPPHLGNFPGVSPATLQIVTMTLLASFILVATPLSFLVAGAILYGCARLFKGDGSYLEQVYTLTLFGVPLVLLSSLLQLIPAANSWLPYLPHLYSLILLVFSLMAVHHRSLGKALAIVLIPLGILLVLALVGTIMLVTLAQHS